MSVPAEQITQDDQAALERRENEKLAQKWLTEITRVRGREKKWRESAQKVIDRYRDDRALDTNAAKFGILWANTETIKPAIFSRMPVPDVRRRWSTKDAAARTAALILERSLTFVNSTFNFKDVLNRVNEDYVLPGRAMAFVCYEPMILNRQVRKEVDPLPPSDPPDKEPEYPEGTQFDGQGAYAMQPEEYKAWESVYVEYVPWNLFGFSECKQWSKCPAMWIGEYMSHADIEKACPDFKDIDALQFKASAEDETSHEKQHDQPPQTILVWKVWHKAARVFMMFAENYMTAPLMKVDDPTQLEQFYPCPEPMYSLRNNGTWIPKPEFLLYQDQANELDIIAERMRSLISNCKNRGVYDQAMDELAKISELKNKADNEFIPIPNFRELAEKGGLQALLDTMPLDKIVEVIAQLREREQELKQQIYELYGIADIMRGASKANETLGAQQLKAQYGALRISTRQERFQEFVREIYRIEAELIAEHFDPDTLRIMTGLQVVPDPQFDQLKQQKQLESGMVSMSEFTQAIKIIKSDKLRGFKVDIETDSTIPVNVEAEQQNRVAFITAIGTYLQGVIPAIEQGAIPVSVAREAMLFVVRGFKIGTELEEVLEELGDDGDQAENAAKMKQMLQQLQKQNQELTQENQQLKSGAEVKIQQAQIKAASDQQIAESKQQREMLVEGQQQTREMQGLILELLNNRLIADANNQAKIQVAEITAKSAENVAATTAASYEPSEASVQ